MEIFSTLFVGCVVGLDSLDGFHVGLVIEVSLIWSTICSVVTLGLVRLEVYYFDILVTRTYVGIPMLVGLSSVTSLFCKAQEMVVTARKVGKSIYVVMTIWLDRNKENLFIREPEVVKVAILRRSV